MTTELVALAALPDEVYVGAGSMFAHPLRLLDLAELDRTLQEIAPGEDLAVLSGEGNERLFADPRGVAAMLRCVGRQSHPELDRSAELAESLAKVITLPQWRRVLDVAFRELGDPKAS